MDAMNRVVVGLKLPPEIMSGIANCQAEIRRKGADSAFRPTSPGEICIAVCSPPEMPPAKVMQLIEATKQVCAQLQPFTLQVEGLGGDPNAVQPRTAWVGVTGADALSDISKKILMQLGFPADQNSVYAPKIEIGRLRQLTDPGRNALGRAIKIAPKSTLGSILVDHFDIMLSVGTSAGPELRVHERAQFAAGVVPPPVIPH